MHLPQGMGGKRQLNIPVVPSSHPGRALLALFPPKAYSFYLFSFLLPVNITEYNYVALRVMIVRIGPYRPERVSLFPAGAVFLAERAFPAFSFAFHDSLRDTGPNRSKYPTPYGIGVGVTMMICVGAVAAAGRKRSSGTVTTSTTKKLTTSQRCDDCNARSFSRPV